MIIKGLLELIFSLLKIVFSPVSLPKLPSSVDYYLNQFIEWILGGYNFLCSFIDMNTVKALIPIVIVIANLDRIWSFIMFILRKIPFIGVEQSAKMRTHCGHSTQLVSLRDTRNAGCNVAQCFSSVRAGLTGSCVCCSLLYGSVYRVVGAGVRLVRV